MKAFNPKKMNKASICMVIVAAWLSLPVLSQEQNRYVRIDAEVVQDVKNDVIGDMKPSTEESKIIYDALIDKAFDKYFGNKKVKADDIVENDSVKVLLDAIDLLEDEIKRLRKDSAKLAESVADVDKNYISRDSVAGMADSLQAMRKAIAAQDSALQFARSQNEANADMVKELKLQLSKFDKVNERLIAAKVALQESDSICIVCRLAEIVGAGQLQETATGYMELMSMLGIEAEAAETAQAERINAVCMVAALYGRGVKQLAGRFDQNANAALLQESAKMESQLRYLSAGQRGELADMTDALKSEQYAIKNFRNGIIAPLRELGCIADDGVAEDAYKNIDTNIKLFTSNKYQEPGGYKYEYNPLYVNVNEQLRLLRIGIKEKKLDDPVPYNEFLDEISESLGE